MKHLGASSLALAALLSGVAHAQTPAPIRTLDEALKAALERSPAIQQARERLVKTQKTIDQILSARNPQVSLRATYTRLLNAGSGFGGGGGGGTQQVQNPFGVQLPGAPPGTTPVQLSTSSFAATGSGAAATVTRAAGPTRQVDFGGGVDLNQESINASVTQLLDVAGVIRTAQAIGDTEMEIQGLEMERTRQEISLSVKNGYYNVLRAEALVAVAQAAVAQSEEQLRVTQAQKNAGVVAEFDVLRARTQLANNQQSLISARNQVAIARNAFANSLGLNPSTPIELTPPTELPQAPPLDEAALIDKAQRQRPEARQADLTASKARKSTQLAGRGLKPSLVAVLSGNFNPNPAFIGDQETGSLSLVLSVPLSDGGSTRAQVANARADERLAAIQIDQYRRGIQAEVQQAIIAVKDAIERREAAQANLAQAREAHRLAGVRFKAGVDTQLSVNDAQTALTQAETNAVNARYDYLNALARLRRALGDPE